MVYADEEEYQQLSREKVLGQPTAQPKLFGDDQEDQSNAQPELRNKCIAKVSTYKHLPLYISLLRKNRTLEMKNIQLQIKVKTLTDELRQKEIFDRLDFLA